jgi:uncharacterized protein (TIGR00661 family)
MNSDEAIPSPLRSAPLRKLLLLPWGNGMGHLARCLAVAAEVIAVDRTDVTVVVPDRLAGFVEGFGCRAAALPSELTAKHPWADWDDVEHVAASVKADAELLERYQPDVLVHDSRWSSAAAGELLGIPSVTIAQYNVNPGFLFPEPTDEDFWGDKFPAFQKVLGELNLNTLRADIREIFFRHPMVIPSIPEFDYLHTDTYVDAVTYVGPLVPRQRAADESNTVDLPDDRTIVYVYGVQTQADLDYFLNEFSGHRYHLFLPGLPPGAQIDPSLTNPSVTVEPFTPLENVLPHCSAAVIHGGHGSCLTVLKYGLPTVVLPAHIEQRSNASRLSDLGVALTLSEEERHGRLAEAVDRVISEPTYRTNGRRWQKRVGEFTGSPGAAEVVRRCVGTDPHAE